MYDPLDITMPGLSPLQKDLRKKMIVARDFSNARLVEENQPYHAHQLYTMIGEIVNAWIFTPMPDEVLKRVVDHCRNLAKAAGEAEWMFRSEIESGEA